MPAKYIPGQLIGPNKIKLLGITRVTSYGHKYGNFCCPNCGKTFEAKVYHVNSGAIKYCPDCRGLVRSGQNNPNFKNLVGMRYGKLVVIELLGSDQSLINNRISQEKKNVWRCQCDCGNFINRTTNELTSGSVSSCGQCSFNSKGEHQIAFLLGENNIKYESQKKFSSCKDKKELPFDFYLPEYNVLIEYDGLSHYSSNPYGSWNSEENLLKTQEHDKIKNEWCKENQITLIRIPYTHLKDIVLNDLLPQTSPFIVK